MVSISNCRKGLNFGIFGWFHMICISLTLFLFHLYFYEDYFPKNFIFSFNEEYFDENAQDVDETTSLFSRFSEKVKLISDNDPSKLISDDNKSKDNSDNDWIKNDISITQQSLKSDADYVERDYYNSDVELLIEKGSSVWCWGSSHKDRICRFQNLCYFPDYDDFVFLHSPESIKFGVPTDQFNPALLDLSSVFDHNQQYFNYVDLPSAAVQHFDVEFISSKSLIFKRFNPDNLMHVIHDDLLPIFYTLEWMRKDANSSGIDPDIQLVFIEGWNAGDYFALYELFSEYKPLMLSDLSRNSHITCFKDTYVGISKSTVWYQYGFSKPQGPVADIMLGGPEIRKFTNFILYKMNYTSFSSFNMSEPFGILLSRKQNRIIVNEIELSIALARELNMRIFIVGFETHTWAEIILLVSKATLLIGMHGSLLIFSMFLPPESIFIELYPYAVNPDHYTPYKTLGELPGMNIIYKSWRNYNKSNTVTHVNRPWDTGGIAHLSESEQSYILNSQEVPLHLCCRNPEWLFRIYQDTKVDIFTLISIVKVAVLEKNSVANKDNDLSRTDTKYFRIRPSFVQNIICENQTMSHNIRSLKSSTMKISWLPPWNIDYIQNDNIKYEVWLQEYGFDHYTAWILSQTSYHFTTGLKSGTKYFVWIRCILDDVFHGPFNIKQIICYT